MQTKSKAIKKQKAYLTIYLSLVFGIILSLILGLIEGVAIGACRLQSHCVADLGMDSIFAEYNRQMLSQYGLFFLDDSYGAKKGNLGNVENHLANHMSYNLNPAKITSFFGMHNLLQMENTYLEIDEVAFATDNNGDVFKAAAVELMKQKTGIAVIEKLKKDKKSIEENNLLDMDVGNYVDGKKSESGISETNERVDSETPTGWSYNILIDTWDELKGYGAINRVISSKENISSKEIKAKDYISYAMKYGSINKGCGNPKHVDDPNGIVDELLFTEYLMDRCGNYRNSKTNSRLDYEIEYILFGKEKDYQNLRETIERLIAIRAASNFLYLNEKDHEKKDEAKTVATIISIICEIPEATDAITQMILGIWSYAEAVLDVKCLMNGGKISIMKDKNEWNLSLIELISMKSHWSKSGKSSDKNNSMTYQDYLKVLLATKNPKEKVARSMDIVEMNIRQTEGNENFRIDQCINYITATIGFKDSRKHEYLLTKTMRYE